MSGCNHDSYVSKCPYCGAALPDFYDLEICKVAESYMLAVKRLGDDSGFNGLSYFEAPISGMPTVEMAQEASIRWVDLNNSGKKLTAAISGALSRREKNKT